jgi:hypothetical protein
MLLCTLSTADDRHLARIIQAWLDAQGLHFTLHKIENGYEYRVSQGSLSKKSAIFIKYHTLSSKIELRLHVGKRADVQAFADVLHEGAEEILFRIESWA